MKNLSIILVNPQMGENIGFVARVIKNLNYFDLRIVNPRDGWPNSQAISTAAGADDVLNTVNVFNSVEKACNDLNYLFATTVRKRDLNVKTTSLFEVFNSVDNSLFINNNIKIGILFGCESSGLSNKDLSNANQLIFIPTNNKFSSLNLSHAVTIVCWEFVRMFQEKKNNYIQVNQNNLDLASLKELNFFFKNLEQKLSETGFFQSDDMKKNIIQNIKILFSRSNLSSQEIRILNGIIKSLFDYNKQA